MSLNTLVWLLSYSGISKSNVLLLVKVKAVVCFNIFTQKSWNRNVTKGGIKLYYFSVIMVDSNSSKWQLRNMCKYPTAISCV